MDLNHRPPGYESGALSRLSYTAVKQDGGPDGVRTRDSAVTGQCVSAIPRNRKDTERLHFGKAPFGYICPWQGHTFFPQQSVDFGGDQPAYYVVFGGDQPRTNERCAGWCKIDPGPISVSILYQVRPCHRQDGAGDRI